MFHMALWETIVIVAIAFNRVNGVPPGRKIRAHNRTIRGEIMVCIACISNVNQLGSIPYCHVMAEHLQGNRGRFLCTIYGFPRCQFPQAKCWDKQRNPAKRFLWAAVQKVDMSQSYWLSVFGRLNFRRQLFGDIKIYSFIRQHKGLQFVSP